MTAHACRSWAENGFNRQLAGLVALALALVLPTPAAAMCLASGDPVVERLTQEVERDPQEALRLIDGELARTPQSDIRRIGWLQIVKASAVHRTGGAYPELAALAKATSARLAKGDPLAFSLKLFAIETLGNDAGDVVRQVNALLPEMRLLPQGPALGCANLNVGDTYLAAYRPAEGFPYVAEAYRGSRAADIPPAQRAAAASSLSALASIQGDYDYAIDLTSQSLGYYLPNRQHYRAMRELMVRGWSHLKGGNSASALRDFRLSAVEARKAGNPMGAAYAQANECDALLAADRLDEARPVCGRAYRTLIREGWAGLSFAAVLQGELLVRSGEPRRALAVLDPLIEKFGPALSANEYGTRAYQNRARAYEMLGKPDLAYADMAVAAKTMQDNAAQERKMQMAVTRARFHTEQLKADLALEESDHAASLRLFGLAGAAGAAVFALLAGLAYILARHRRIYRHQALTDTLTGLANRRHTSQLVGEMVAHAAARGGKAVVAVIDLDHFKSCNDRFGHDAGDEALQAFARIVESRLRMGDLIGRWGGEEFLLALPDTDLVQARLILTRLRRAAAAHDLELAPDYRLRFSAGVAAVAGSDDTLESLVARADTLLYRAKAEGRDQACYADEPPPRPVPAPEADALPPAATVAASAAA